jgi:hypothetical protein
MSPGKSAKKTMKMYYRVTKRTPQPIRREDVLMTVQSSSSRAREERPNFLALSILWAHFQACEHGLLREDAAGPWNLTAEPSPGHRRWLQFLKSIITDENWSQWIKDEEEMRRRSIEAHGKVISSP